MKTRKKMFKWTYVKEHLWFGSSSAVQVIFLIFYFFLKFFCNFFWKRIKIIIKMLKRTSERVLSYFIYMNDKDR